MSINKYSGISILIPIFLYSCTLYFIDINQTDDASSYIRYFNNAADMIKNYGYRVIVNDIGFLFYLVLLDLMSLRSENILLILSFFNFILILASVIHLTRNDRRLGLLTVLIIFSSPNIALGYIIHLRQGFALGVFMLVLCLQNLNLRDIESENKKIFYASIFASLFHTSFLFIAAIYFLHSLVRTLSRNSLITVTCVCLVVFFLSFLQNSAASLLGARQVYESQTFSLVTNGLGGGFIFFALFALLGLVTVKEKKKFTPFFISFIYLAFYLVNPLAGRFLLILLPLIILSMMYSKNFLFYASIFITFNMLSFNSVLDQI